MHSRYISSVECLEGYSTMDGWHRTWEGVVVVCRIDRDCWLRSCLAQPSFHLLGASRLIPDLSRTDETITVHRLAVASRCKSKYAINSPPNSVE